MSTDIIDSEHIAKWVINTTSLITLGFFLFRLIKLPKKGFDSLILLMIDGSAFVFSAIGILSLLFLTSDGSAIVFGATELTLYNFLLYWTTAVAILTYRVVKKKKSYSFRLWATLSFAASVGLAIAYLSLLLFNVGSGNLTFSGVKGIYSIQFSTDGDEVLIHILIYQLFFTMIPIIITAFCYFEVYVEVRKNGLNSLRSLQLDTSKIFLCSVAQIVCFVPKILVDIFHPSNDVALLVSFTLFQAWGVLNGLAYWQVRTADKDFGKEMLGNESSGMTGSLVLGPDRI